MRWGRFLWVLALLSAAASGATPPGAIARARQLFESGVTLERSGQYQQAIDVLTLAIQFHALRGEDAARALFDRGVAFDALGNAQQAVKDYSAALRLAPRLSAAWSNRANVYRRQGRLEQAKRDYLTALRCHGVLSQYPYLGLGLIAEKWGDTDTARDYFEKALAVDPAFALAAQSLSALATAQPSNPAIKTPIPIPPAALSLRAPVRPLPGAIQAASSATMPKDARRKLAPSKPLAMPEPATARDTHPSLRLMIGDSRDGIGRRTQVQIQLGAFRDERTALEAWSKIIAASANVLEGLQPVVFAADIPGRGRFWRLRTNVSGLRVGQRLCSALLEKGQACVLAHG